MSNTLAIAAVTASLRQLLDRVAEPLAYEATPDPAPTLADATCTARTPDQARADDQANQLNLFLFHVGWNAAWRSETATPPVALTLHYLLTAYGKGNDELLAQRLLGRAMTLLHDRPVLSREELAIALPEAELEHQVERVRVTPHPMSTEEMARLWSTFQTPYRLSTAYEVSVVLIDSARPARVARPVLTRSVTARASVVPPFPTISEIAMLGGDAVELVGHDLEPAPLRVTLARELVGEPVAAAVTAESAERLAVALPAAADVLPAGVYAISVATAAGTRAQRLSNALPIVITPRFTARPPGARVDGRVPITVDVTPHVWPGQRVGLVVGDVECVAPPRTGKVATVEVRCPVAAGTHALRLRVDGVESAPADSTQTITLPA